MTTTAWRSRVATFRNEIAGAATIVVVLAGCDPQAAEPRNGHGGNASRAASPHLSTGAQPAASNASRQPATTDAPRPTTAAPPHSTTTAAPFNKPTAAPAQSGWPAPDHRKGRFLSLRDAKRTLRKLYAQQPQRTLYANCAFDNWRVNWKACCYTPRNGERKRLEWEHVVPASAFGRHTKAWRQGDASCRNRHGSFKGRKCARRADPQFRAMEADMHNLFPAIGEINEDRAYYPMALIEGEARQYGSCDVEIRNRQIEPRPGARGEIARAYLYMHWRYPSFALLSDSAKAMMLRWNQLDPPDDIEQARNHYIRKQQQIGNPWIGAR